MVRVLTKPIRESHIGQDPGQVAQALLEAIEKHERDKQRVDERTSYLKCVHTAVSQVASGLFAMPLEERYKLFQSIDRHTGTTIDLDMILEKCTTIVYKNRSIWNTVTNHHAALKRASGEWHEIIASHACELGSYAEAATLMGKKQWVQTGHRWMKMFSGSIGLEILLYQAGASYSLSKNGKKKEELMLPQ